MTLDIKLPSKPQSVSVASHSRVLHIVPDLQKRLQIYPGHANTLPLLEECMATGKRKLNRVVSIEEVFRLDDLAINEQ